MADLVLQAQKRSSEEKVKQLRAQRVVPAVAYGKKQEAISLKLDASDLLRMYRTAGESHIINLDVEGDKIEVLIHDYQKDPITGDFIHVDFYALTRGEKVTTKIHLNFIGDSEAVKEGALLTENVKEIEVSCLPRDLVDAFDVDLSLLKGFDDVIRLSDLAIDSSKYDVHNLHAEDAIAVAAKPKKVEEETTSSDEEVEATEEQEEA